MDDLWVGSCSRDSSGADNFFGESPPASCEGRTGSMMKRRERHRHRLMLSRPHESSSEPPPPCRCPNRPKENKPSWFTGVNDKLSTFPMSRSLTRKFEEISIFHFSWIKPPEINDWYMPMAPTHPSPRRHQFRSQQRELINRNAHLKTSPSKISRVVPPTMNEFLTSFFFLPCADPASRNN